MWGKLFVEQFVRQNACLWEPPNCFSHLQDYMNSEFCNFAVEVILFDDPRWEECNLHFHIFVPIKGCCEIKFYNVKAHVFCLGHADYCVPVQFGGGGVGGLCYEFARLVDQVSSSHDSDAIGILFLRPVGNLYFCIPWGLILGNVRHIFGVHYEHCVCPICFSPIIALTHASKLFSNCSHPDLGGEGVFHQAAVAGHMFSCY
jgi:hypothetical protein